MVFSQILGLFSTISAIIVNFFSMPIMLAFSREVTETGQPDRWGFFWYAAVIGVAAAVCLIISFFLVKEEARDEDPGGQKEKVPFLRGLSYVFRNKYWWIALFLFAVSQFIPSCWAATPYYCIYYTNGAVDPGQLISLLWAGITVGTLLFIPVTRKIGKVNANIIGIGLQLIGGVLLWISPYSIPMLWVTTIFRSVGVGAISGNMAAMMADVGDYGYWKFNVRSEGLTYSAMSLGNKLGVAIGGAIVTALLAWGGYVAGAVEQTAQAMAGIR